MQGGKESQSVCFRLAPARPGATLKPMETEEVQCPTCFEWFSVARPGNNELPAELDYDCEVCCRPLVIQFTLEGAFGKGLHES